MSDWSQKLVRARDAAVKELFCGMPEADPMTDRMVDAFSMFARELGESEPKTDQLFCPRCGDDVEVARAREIPTGYLCVKCEESDAARDVWNAQLRKAMKHLPQSKDAPVTSAQIQNVLTNLKTPSIPWYLTLANSPSLKKSEPAGYEQTHLGFTVKRTLGEVVDLAGEDRPAPPHVRNPEGAFWHLRGNSLPVLLDHLTCGHQHRPLTPAEAFRRGAIVRWHNERLSQIIEGPIEYFGEDDEGWPFVRFGFTADEEYLISACTLIRPAPEEKA